MVQIPGGGIHGFKSPLAQGVQLGYGLGFNGLYGIVGAGEGFQVQADSVHIRLHDIFGVFYPYGAGAAGKLFCFF